MSLASQLSDGQGGLQFTAQAPPGIGRLIRIPFYLTAATPGYAPQIPNTPAANTYYVAAAFVGSVVNPVIMTTNNALGFNPNNAQLATPAISWATLRIVGFECSINGPAAFGAEGIAAGNASTPLATNGAHEIIFQDLQIGGGANLFIHEDWGPANLYLSSNDNFAGLRDYPLLKSPNTARVTMNCQGPVAPTPATVPSGNTTCFAHSLVTCNLVCEILQDDNYGSHVPGPYARKGAMVRRGGSFIS